MSGNESSDAPGADELDDLVDRLMITRAGPGYDRMRGEALAELLGAGKAGHDAIVDRLATSGNPRPLLRVLPLFQLDESVPTIVGILHHPDADAVVRAAAAEALADHPSPDAQQALRDASQSVDQSIAASALAALRRNDRL